MKISPIEFDKMENQIQRLLQMRDRRMKSKTEKEAVEMWIVHFAADVKYICDYMERDL